MPSLTYDAALAASREHHATNKTFSGSLMRPHAPAIKEIIDRLGCSSVLDYGAGKGCQYHWRAGPCMSIPEGLTVEEYWGVPVTKYDPAWPPFSAEPKGTFDLVICTHTLCFVPMKDLRWVVDRLYALAGKALYIAEKLQPAAKKPALRDPAVFPVNWPVHRWLDTIRRPGAEIEVTVALRTRDHDEARITRHRL